VASYLPCRDTIAANANGKIAFQNFHPRDVAVSNRETDETLITGGPTPIDQAIGQLTLSLIQNDQRLK